MKTLLNIALIPACVVAFLCVCLAYPVGACVALCREETETDA